MKIVVYAICKNEEKFAGRWVKSMGEADGICVLDTGSDDGTVQILKESGACVTEENISPWRFDAARNRSLELVPEDADVCVCTDLDEVFEPGWRNKLKSAWAPGTCRAAYRYTWSFQPNGTEGHVFYLDKIHSRRGYRWTHPVHEVLQWTGHGPEKRITVEGMQLSHHPDPDKSRAQYLPLLELSVRENPEDDRNMHYLGREYLFRGRWDDCIRTLNRHLSLPTATWADERCASMRFIARAYLGKGDGKSAERWFARAVAEAPHLREPYMEWAWMLYRRRDWEGALFLTGRALRITERTYSYITDGAVWGSLPWDIRSLALYHTGRTEEALIASEKALALSPGDERLKANAAMLRREAENSRKGTAAGEISP